MPEGGKRKKDARRFRPTAKAQLRVQNDRKSKVGGVTYNWDDVTAL